MVPHRPGSDVAFAVTADAFAHQQWSDLAGIRDGSAIRPFSAVVVDQAAASGRLCLRDDFAREKLVERQAQEMFCRLGSLSALGELIIDGAPIEDRPILRTDGNA